jgi:hypothetical protein
MIKHSAKASSSLMNNRDNEKVHPVKKASTQIMHKRERDNEINFSIIERVIVSTNKFMYPLRSLSGHEERA